MFAVFLVSWFMCLVSFEVTVQAAEQDSNGKHAINELTSPGNTMPQKDKCYKHHLPETITKNANYVLL